MIARGALGDKGAQWAPGLFLQHSDYLPDDNVFGADFGGIYTKEAFEADRGAFITGVTEGMNAEQMQHVKEYATELSSCIAKEIVVLKKAMSDYRGALPYGKLSSYVVQSEITEKTDEGELQERMLSDLEKAVLAHVASGEHKALEERCRAELHMWLEKAFPKKPLPGTTDVEELFERAYWNNFQNSSDFENNTERFFTKNISNDDGCQALVQCDEPVASYIEMLGSPAAQKDFRDFYGKLIVMLTIAGKDYRREKVGRLSEEDRNLWVQDHFEAIRTCALNYAYNHPDCFEGIFCHPATGEITPEAVNLFVFSRALHFLPLPSSMEQNPPEERFVGIMNPREHILFPEAVVDRVYRSNATQIGVLTSGLFILSLLNTIDYFSRPDAYRPSGAIAVFKGISEFMMLFFVYTALRLQGTAWFPNFF